MIARGTHLLLELRGCPAALLNDPREVERALRAAAEAAEAHVVSAAFHTFTPQGVTGVLLLAESHLAIHTWPEHGYAAVDLFTCGARDPAEAVPALRTLLQAGEVAWTTVERGLFPRQDGR